MLLDIAKGKNPIVMPLQNRITPEGEFIAHPSRAGLFMGNRGILHDETKRLGQARWRHKHWIICRLAFGDRHREVMAKGAYTELFFLDEAVALAAGHRPCAQCRRDAFNAFRAAIAGPGNTPWSAKAIDDVLHRLRIDERMKMPIRVGLAAETLPDGAFIKMHGECWLIVGDKRLRYRPSGYDQAEPKPSGLVQVLTPMPTLGALRKGYRPILHESAKGLIG